MFFLFLFIGNVGFVGIEGFGGGDVEGDWEEVVVRWVRCGGRVGLIGILDFWDREKLEEFLF